MSEVVRYKTPVISIDVEDWPQSTWDRNLPITERAAQNTRRLLQLLGEENVRATMFILGKFAERFPDVVKEIQADGHEIACHGHGHLEVFRQSPDEFLDDIRRSKDLLEQITGKPVKGYRAPDFSIVRETLWALDMLVAAGFEYDSSIVPARLPRYGIAGWPVVPVRAQLSSGSSILEAPLPTLRVLGRNWPVGGGGYHRLLPGVASRYCARKVMMEVPFVFYCHPYEFDVRELSEIAIPVPLTTRFYQGAGRRWFEQRFRDFLGCFGGYSMQEMLSSQLWQDFRPSSLDHVLDQSRLNSESSRPGGVTDRN